MYTLIGAIPARHHIESTLLTVLETFANFSDIKKHKPAAILLYYLIHNDCSAVFKEQLNENKQLEILKFNPHYSAVFNVELLFSNEINEDESIELNDVQIKSGYSLQQIVAPKEVLKEFIAVYNAPAILHVSFTTVNYNIGFSIERVGSLKLANGQWQEQENQAFERYSLCDSHLKPISKNLLINKPGLFKIIWHNSYSYLKAKTVKYRIRVLTQASDEKSVKLKDILSVGDLNQEEMVMFQKLRKVYPDYIPIVRIIRP